MLRSSARSPFRSLPVLFLLTFLLAVLVACQPKTPEEKIAEARAAYTVELNSWFPREPEPEPIPEADPAAAEGEVAEEGATAAEAAEAEAESEDADGADGADGELEVVDVDNVGPRTVNVLFDLIVLFEGDEPLSGLTLEIAQGTADGGDKNSWRHYQELPSHIKGETKQVSFELEGVEFEDGDQFSVTVRPVVPPEERGDYQEFATAAP